MSDPSMKQAHRGQSCTDATSAPAASRKRKADSLSRVAETGISKGRGSLSGWTTCSLCGKYSSKKYALGRGVASHLRAVHTPWKPSKLARKIRRRQHEERERERNLKRRRLCQDSGDCQPQESSESNEAKNNIMEQWEPNQQEIDDWEARILQIVKKVEEQHSSKAGDKIPADRSGQQVESYRESLPPFLLAASNGDIENLRTFVNTAMNKEESGGSISELLNTKDRHLSTAEHWAAGGGHLDCLKLILGLRQKYVKTKSPELSAKKIRRRDGKTCLHYAARNGHLECVKYLLKDANYAVDEISGEGTTPLHIACYGGHVVVAKYLIERGANVLACNEWGCNAAHWVGMTISESTPNVRELCTLLKEKGVSFVERQQQGHSSLHKAAQRRNRHVIQWMADPLDAGGAGLSKEELRAAGGPDLGGHCPSQIWRNLGGETEFADWMHVLGW